jgi:hypothetical protein
MAIVASKRGGLIECPGGAFQKNGEPAIKALSWQEVNEIAKRFEVLNPYDLPGSALEIEKDNFDAETGDQRQLWCVAISAKRYALFLRNADGEPELLRKDVNNKNDRFSEHGLGHLMNPSDPASEDKKWIAAAWLAMIRKSLGLTTKLPRFAKRMAVGRVSVSSPAVMKAFSTANNGKQYSEQIKPFNFIISCHVRKLGHPIDADPEQFHLIAPYETDPRKWASVRWTNQYTNKQYRVSASAAQPSRTMARVKSYGDILEDYEYHPESKCTDASGAACEKQSIGLLGRRHIMLDGIMYIGKESNNLEDVEAETTTDAADVYTEYPDSKRDEWETKWLPILQNANVPELMNRGVSRATIYAVRSGRPMYRGTRSKLIRILNAIEAV